MEYHCIFFDLDGTLIDSKERLYRLFSDLVPASAISFGEYWNYKLNKISNEWILENKLGIDSKSIQLFKKSWMELIEKERYLQFDKLFPDTIAVLDNLFEHIDLYVVTARQSHSALINQLQTLGINKYFKSVLITEQKRTKADLIRSLNLEYSNSIIVGDTGEETLVGRDLGMVTANVLTGFRNKSVLESYSPDYIFTTLTEFAEILKLNRV